MKALDWFKPKDTSSEPEAQFEDPKSPYSGIKGEKYRQVRMRLPNGAAWNPLMKYPRNKGCFCGSGTKAKKCCLPSVSRVVQEKYAIQLNEMWFELLTGKQTLPRAPR